MFLLESGDLTWRHLFERWLSAPFSSPEEEKWKKGQDALIRWDDDTIGQFFD